MRFRPASLALAVIAAFAASPRVLAADPPILELSAQAAMTACSEIWSLESEQELDAYIEDIKGEFNTGVSQAESNIAKARAEIAEQEKRVAALTAAWEQKLAGTVEEAAKAFGGAGWSNAPQVAKAVGANGADEAARQELNEARDKLDALRRRLERLKLAYASLGSIRAIIESCARGQREYLKTAGSPEPGQITPPGEMPGTNDTFAANYKFEKCQGSGTSWPKQGRVKFTLGAGMPNIPNAYWLKAIMDFGGTPVELTGALDNMGSFSVEGVHEGITLEMSGSYARDPTGALKAGIGIIQGSAPTGNNGCFGKFSG